METVKVISHLDRTLRGRYDGKDYVFVKGKATLLSLDAAAHIFDLGQDDKRNCLNRLGLMLPGDSYEEKVKLIDQISFLEGKVVFEDELQAPPVAAVEASDGGARKTGGRRPHVGPSGDAGDGQPSPA